MNVASSALEKRARQLRRRRRRRRLCRWPACRQYRHRGSLELAQQAGPRGLDRPARAGHGAAEQRAASSSICMISPSRTPIMPISGRRSSNMATPCSSWRARRSSIDGSIAFGETHLFVGEGYLVSVRHGPSTSYTPVRERCESCPRALARGEDYILYAILDFIVDNYSPVLETIHDEVEAMEDAGACERDDARADRAAVYAAARSVATAKCGRAPGGGLPPARA